MMMPFIALIGFSVGLLVGVSINRRLISKTIKEAKKQMEISRQLIEQNKKILQ